MPNTELIPCVVALISIKEILISLSGAGRRPNPAAKSAQLFHIPHRNAAQRRKENIRMRLFPKKPHLPAAMQQRSNAASQRILRWENISRRRLIFSLSTFFFSGSFKAARALMLLSRCYLNPPNPLKTLQNFLRSWSAVGSLGRVAFFWHFWAAEHSPRDFFPRRCSGRNFQAWGGFSFPVSRQIAPRMGWEKG